MRQPSSFWCNSNCFFFAIIIPFHFFSLFYLVTAKHFSFGILKIDFCPWFIRVKFLLKTHILSCMTPSVRNSFLKKNTLLSICVVHVWIKTLHILLKDVFIIIVFKGKSFVSFSIVFFFHLFFLSKAMIKKLSTSAKLYQKELWKDQTSIKIIRIFSAINSSQKAPKGQI